MMPLSSRDERKAWLLDFKAWLLDWFDEEHPECESAVDLFIVLLEDLGYFLEEHQVSDAEHELIIAVCLDVFLNRGDFWTSEEKRDIIQGCEERLHVTITRMN